MQITHNGKQHQVLAKRPPKGWCEHHGWAHQRGGGQGHVRRRHKDVFKAAQADAGSPRDESTLTEASHQDDLTEAVWIDWKEVFPGKPWLANITMCKNATRKQVSQTKTNDESPHKPLRMPKPDNAAAATKALSAETLARLEPSQILPIRSSKDRPGKFDLFR